METVNLKTDIKCLGCIEQVTPYLNEVAGEDNWEVDIQNPLKILTVNGETNVAKIREAVSKAGFKADKIS